MSRLHELLGGEEETFGPGIDLVISICAILLIVLALVLQLYRGSSAASIYFQGDIKTLMRQLDECSHQKASQDGVLTRLNQKNEQLQFEMEMNNHIILLLREQLAEGESHGEQLRTQFGELISRAAVVLQDLKKDLETEDFPIAIEQRPDRLYFDMGVYFPFDSADLTDIPPDQQERIRVIGDAFRRILDQRIRVGTDVRKVSKVMRVIIEGHTDDKRPAKDYFVNYHFAKERAFSVMKLLMKESKLIPPEYKISIAGYAEYGRLPFIDPLILYDREAVRDKMRRVTISIAPDYDVLQYN